LTIQSSILLRGLISCTKLPMVRASVFSSSGLWSPFTPPHPLERVLLWLCYSDGLWVHEFNLQCEFPRAVLCSLHLCHSRPVMLMAAPEIAAFFEYCSYCSPLTSDFTTCLFPFALTFH
jgi:hypothetical protein